MVREDNIIFVRRKKNRYVISFEKELKYVILSPEILGFIELSNSEIN